MTIAPKSSIFARDSRNSSFAHNAVKLMLSAEYCAGWKDAIDDLIKSFGPNGYSSLSAEMILVRALHMTSLADGKKSALREHIDYLELRLRGIEENVLPDYEKLLSMRTEFLDFQAKHKTAAGKNRKPKSKRGVK